MNEEDKLILSKAVLKHGSNLPCEKCNMTVTSDKAVVVHEDSQYYDHQLTYILCPACAVTKPADIDPTPSLIIGLTNPKIKWKMECPEVQLVIETPKNVSWWIRFWTKFFFGAQWKKQ